MQVIRSESQCCSNSNNSSDRVRASAARSAAVPRRRRAGAAAPARAASWQPQHAHLAVNGDAAGRVAGENVWWGVRIELWEGGGQRVAALLNVDNGVEV
eukprot:353574-Chlamydomonas_euryale.AAC.1